MYTGGLGDTFNLWPTGSECAEYGTAASVLNPLSWFSCLSYDVPNVANAGVSAVASSLGTPVIIGLGVLAAVLLFGGHR